MSQNKTYKVLGLFVGQPKTLSNQQVSAIQKTSVERLQIKKHELPGDQPADTKHHGGDMRVIHHYSQVNYNHLKATFPDIADRFKPGTFGENLYTEELTEADLCIGDIYTLGTAKVQLTVARRPCATLNQTYDHEGILQEVIDSGHVGWFYRVLEEGEVKIGDSLTFLERPHPELRVSALFQQGYNNGEKFTDRAFLQACYETGLMDKGWKPKLDKLFHPK